MKKTLFLFLLFIISLTLSGQNLKTHTGKVSLTGYPNCTESYTYYLDEYGHEVRHGKYSFSGSHVEELYGVEQGDAQVFTTKSTISVTATYKNGYYDGVFTEKTVETHNYGDVRNNTMVYSVTFKDGSPAGPFSVKFYSNGKLDEQIERTATSFKYNSGDQSISGSYDAKGNASGKWTVKNDFTWGGKREWILNMVNGFAVSVATFKINDNTPIYSTDPQDKAIATSFASGEISFNELISKDYLIFNHYNLINKPGGYSSAFAPLIDMKRLVGSYFNKGAVHWDVGPGDWFKGYICKSTQSNIRDLAFNEFSDKQNNRSNWSEEHWADGWVAFSYPTTRDDLFPGDLDFSVGNNNCIYLLFPSSWYEGDVLPVLEHKRKEMERLEEEARRQALAIAEARKKAEAELALKRWKEKAQSNLSEYLDKMILNDEDRDNMLEAQRLIDKAFMTSKTSDYLHKTHAIIEERWGKNQDVYYQMFGILPVLEYSIIEQNLDSEPYYAIVNILVDRSWNKKKSERDPVAKRVRLSIKSNATVEPIFDSIVTVDLKAARSVAEQGVVAVVSEAEKPSTVEPTTGKVAEPQHNVVNPPTVPEESVENQQVIVPNQQPSPSPSTDGAIYRKGSSLLYTDTNTALARDSFSDQAKWIQYEKGAKQMNIGKYMYIASGVSLALAGAGIAIMSSAENDSTYNIGMYGTIAGLVLTPACAVTGLILSMSGKSKLEAIVKENNQGLATSTFSMGVQPNGIGLAYNF